MSAWLQELLVLAVTVAAVYRVSSAVAYEDGPFDLFTRLRALDAEQKTWIGRGLSCFFCVSFWLALGAALLLRPAWQFTGSWLLDWLGLAGLTALLRAYVTKSGWRAS